jgi:hypothetical protein
MANHGDQLAVATRLDPDDTKPVLGILVSDALNPASSSRSDGFGSVFMMFAALLKCLAKAYLPNKSC